MSLKAITSLKFILIFLFSGLIIFSYYHVYRYDSALEKQNNLYIQNDKFSDLEKEMSPTDTTGIAKLNELIEENKAEIKKQNLIKDSIPHGFYSACIFVCLFIGTNIIAYLNNEIEKKKEAINNDNGEMLL